MEDRKGEAFEQAVVKRYGETNRILGVEKVVAMVGGSLGGCKIAVGRKNGIVDVLEETDGSVCASFECAKGKKTVPHQARVRGMSYLRDFESILVCSRGGGVSICSTKGGWEKRTEFNVSGPVDCAKVNCTKKIMAFGGEGAELSVVDISREGEQTWRAKPAEANKLGIRPKSFLSALDFVGQDSRKVIVGTADHEVRLYDVGAQRSPVACLQFGESRVTNIASQPNGAAVWLANAIGTLQKLDMRKMVLEACLRGPCASIRSLCHHEDDMLLASAGLDRFCRVHDTITRKTTFKHYLKNQLTAVCFLPPEEDGNKEEGDDGDVEIQKKLHNRANSSPESGLQHPLKKVKRSRRHRI